MGKTTIEWATHTANFAAGCAEASPECDNCYARLMSARLGSMEHAPARYRGVTTGHGTGARWTGEINADHAALVAEFRKLANRREPARVFLGSMTDLFHAKVPRPFLYSLLELIAHHDRHVYMLLTKRATRMRRVINDWTAHHHGGRPIPNLWVGVTAGTEASYLARMDDLARTRAAVRFLSMEPLLEGFSLSLVGTAPSSWGGGYTAVAAFIDWVIVGGESGSRARPMHPAWVRRLRDECEEHEIPFMFKQWGRYAPADTAGERGDPCVAYLDGMYPDLQFGLLDERRPHTWLVPTNKHDSGRQLDGRTHDDLPYAWAYHLRRVNAGGPRG